MEIKNKVGRPPPQWLINLNSGSYELNELVNITGKSKRTIRETLKLHGARIKYIVKENRKSYSVYEWDGFK